MNRLSILSPARRTPAGTPRAFSLAVVVDADPRAVLQDQFGLDAFRPGQERIVRALLDGRDVLAVLPTGAGKSLVYQLTAQLLDGLTVVVSPLLALMKDQVESLQARGIPVEVINSAQTDADADAAFERVRARQTRLLYVTPERFEDADFLDNLRRLPIALFVVDEAHSISEWGHSFRPAYLTLGSVARQLGATSRLALTATATPWVRQDIVERLGMRQPQLVVRGVDRPNLYLEVLRVEEETEDRRALRRLLGMGDADDQPDAELSALMQGSGIVYAATTRGAEEAAAWMREWGIAADAYHGQRRKADRVRVQDAFMAGELRVIAATNAFGMGVDKPDVRFVIHRDVPPNLEEYWQEAGRAGRDGQPARCTLIYRAGDLGRAAFLGASGTLTLEDLHAARKGLLERPSGTLRELETATGLSRGDLARAISLLKSEGLLAERRGRFRLTVDDFDPATISLEGEAQRKAYERSRLQMMQAYAELRECRRRFVLNYFGEEMDAQTCGWCDVDRRRADTPPAEMSAAGEAPFAVSQRVQHPGWGAGSVQHVGYDTVTVLFDRVGYKTLDLALAISGRLLEPLAA